METIVQDMRYGLRMLLKRPGFTLIAVITLALGIGANGVIFSTIDALVFRPLPFKDVDRMVVVWETRLEQGIDKNLVAPADYLDLQEQNRVFDQVCAYRFWSANLTGRGEPELLKGFLVSPAFFKVLGVEAGAGRTFLPEEATPGREQVVILGHGYWQSRFGGDPKILGSALTLNGKNFTVVGIMPADFNFPRGASEFWAPLAITPEDRSQRAVGAFSVLARLKPGVSLAQAQTELSTITERLALQYPDTNADKGTRVVMLNDEVVDKYTPAFAFILLGAVIFVLLIACANVANLQLARASDRQKEMAIRAALGATRARIIRQLLTENLIISAAGAAIGLLLCMWGIDYIKASVPQHIQIWVAGFKNINIDERVVGFSLLLAVMAGLTAGLAPALEASKLELTETLKEGGKGTTGGAGGQRIKNILVTCEVALALVLLVGAVVMVKGFNNLVKIDQGFDQKNLLTMRVALPETKYPVSGKVVDFYDQVLQRVKNVSGVASAAAVYNLPSSTHNREHKTTGEFSIEGRSTSARDHKMIGDFQVITPEYFQCLGVPLLQGRLFSNGDRAEVTRVAIISESVAERYWRNEDPIGKRIKIGSGDADSPWLTIVGVVGNVRHHSGQIDREPRLNIYQPLFQAPRNAMSLVVRYNADAAAVLKGVRAEIASLDRDQPIYEIRTMEQVITEKISGLRLASNLMATFGLVAFMLAVIGVYGVISYSVSQRTHEIGIRIALGAQPRDVVRLVMGQSFQLALWGIALGLPAAVILTKIMASALFGLVALEVSTFVGITLLLAAVALLSGYIPARRATRVDPLVALRCE